MYFFENGEITGDSYELRKEIPASLLINILPHTGIFYDTGVEIELLGTLQPGEEGYISAIEYSYDETTKH